VPRVVGVPHVVSTPSVLGVDHDDTITPAGPVPDLTGRRVR